jgi:hypothetical protein
MVGAIAPPAAPAAGMPVSAGIAVSIHIMAPAISVWKGQAGWAASPGRSQRGWSGPNQSAAHTNRATCSRVAAAGSDRQVIAIRAAHIALQKTFETVLRAALTPPGTLRSSVRGLHVRPIQVVKLPVFYRLLSWSAACGGR